MHSSFQLYRWNSIPIRGLLRFTPITYVVAAKNICDLSVVYIFIAPTGAVAFTNAHFGAGVGPIYLDAVDCTGSESNLTDCFRSFIVSCSSHSEDAGVRCQGELHLDSTTTYTACSIF